MRRAPEPRSVMLLASALVALALAGCPTFTSEDEPSFQPEQKQGGDEPGDGERAGKPGGGKGGANQPERPSRGEPDKQGNPGDKAQEQVAARHVLVQYKGSARAGSDIQRSKKEARERAQKVLQKARAGDDFAKLAREFSDGPSGKRGGDLGKFPKGRMHPAFEEAAFSLKVGAVSDVVETPFGFHVIKRYR